MDSGCAAVITVAALESSPGARTHFACYCVIVGCGDGVQLRQSSACCDHAWGCSACGGPHLERRDTGALVAATCLRGSFDTRRRWRTEAWLVAAARGNRLAFAGVRFAGVTGVPSASALQDKSTVGGRSCTRGPLVSVGRGGIRERAETAATLCASRAPWQQLSCAFSSRGPA